MSRNIKLVLAFGYALQIGTVLLLASVPPVSRDALTHHLALPKLWVAHGGVHDTPDIVFSYYPQLLDLLYTLPLMLGHDIAAKYVHFVFALLTAAIIFLFVRRRLGTAWAAASGLLFLTIPVVLKLSVTVYVDLGLIFFSAAALFAVVLWLEDPARLKWLLIAGVAGGLALGTKYSALVPTFALGLLLPFFFLRSGGSRGKDQARAIGYATVFAAATLLVFSPWLVRNYSLTGNPVYPLAQGVFATEAQQGDATPKKLGPLLVRKLVYEESLPYTLLIPIRVFYEGEDDDPQFFDGRMNLLLLLLPLALLAVPRKYRVPAPEGTLFGAYAVLVILLVFLIVDMRIRWIAAVIPPLVVLTTYGLHALYNWMAEASRSRAAGRILVAALLVAYFAPNALYAKALYDRILPLSYLGGELSRADYIQKYRPEFAAISLANELVPDDGRALGLYLGSRRYYFSVDATLDNELFTRTARAATSGSDIAARLAGDRYTHLVIRADFFSRWVETLDDETRAKVAAFVQNHLRQLELQEGYGLFEIVGAPNATGFPGDPG